MGDHDERRAFEVGAGQGVPVGPGHGSTFDGSTLDFGHYAGRKIAELAEEDPDYLRWLARHPSGVRYRAEIARVLASAVPRAGDWQR
jgi:broad specificity phosphatase PhoE